MEVQEAGDTYYTLSEVEKHNGESSEKWIVIGHEIYDVTSFINRHPGGKRILLHHCGQDATDAFQAFHPIAEKSTKYLTALKIGQTSPSEQETPDIVRDFRELRSRVESMGWMKPDWKFYTLVFLHIMVLEYGAYGLLLSLGMRPLAVAFGIAMIVAAQVQAGWLQHDIGHLSIFRDTRISYLAHVFVMSFTKGALVQWWNHNHNQHHAKPNVISKDPDTRLDALFVVGEVMPVRVARDPDHVQMPYHWQHWYFSFTFPPLLFPLYFSYENLRLLKKARMGDRVGFILYYIKILTVLYIASGSVVQTLAFYFTFRFFESQIFVWISQSNHIPMPIEDDERKDWFSMQLKATCNIHDNLFNTWISGHLNYQIEHHLFPRMPRHNYHKVRPLVESMCNKHGVPYIAKGLFEAFADILRSLEKSGKLWLDAHNAVLRAEM